MLKIFFGYIRWHYTRALLEILINIKVFLHFLYNFFSIGTLTSTFFLPWLGLGEKYKQGSILDFGDRLSSLFVNSIMRLIGMCVRFIVISFGLISMASAVIAGIFLIILWIFYPVVVIFILLSGFRLMFK